MRHPKIDHLLDFWSTLSSEKQTFAKVICLANLTVPYFLSNAAWFYKPNATKEVKKWYQSKHLPVAIIVEAEQNSAFTGFKRKEQFQLREARASASQFIVEQVSWSQMHIAGELLAKHHNQDELKFAISKSLTSAMQENQSILAFIAFDKNAMGVSIVLETEDSLISMLRVDDGSIENHLKSLAASLDKQAFILEEKDSSESRYVLTLERWVLDEN